MDEEKNESKNDEYKIDEEQDEYKVDDYNESSFDDEEKKKKLIKYGIIGFIVLVAFLLLIALFVSSSGSKKEKNTIEKSITLTAGDKYSLNNESGDFKWTSSDNSVAIVTENGQIEALKEGDTTITLTGDDQIFIYKIHVDSLDGSVNLTSVKLSSNTISIKMGEEATLKVDVTPSNATNVELSWFTSNEKVATVNNGRVVAVGLGSCMITVKTSNGNTDTCLVKVVSDEQKKEPGDIEAISFDAENITLKKGITYTLSYDALPNGDDGSIVWESSDEEVATIDYGVIKTLKEGTTTITATSGQAQAIMYVTVVEGDSNTPDVIDDGKTVKATSISLNQEEITLNQGDSYPLISTISPDNATDKSVTWKSSNESVATVDSFGNVTAVTSGEATIEVSTKTGLKATCRVVVNEKMENINNDLTIGLNTNSVTLKVNDTLSLIETVTPDNDVSNVTWQSSNEDVVRVVNGLVTAISTGTATITAKLPNGNYATCTISASNNVVKVGKVSLNVDDLTLKTNGTAQLTATIAPNNATNKTITWSSSNPRVASVDANGKVTGLMPGTTIIVAKASNGIADKATVVVSASAALRPLGKRLPTYGEIK